MCANKIRRMSISSFQAGAPTIWHSHDKSTCDCCRWLCLLASSNCRVVWETEPRAGGGQGTDCCQQQVKRAPVDFWLRDLFAGYSCKNGQACSNPQQDCTDHGTRYR
jgi:hypothetical protein